MLCFLKERVCGHLFQERIQNCLVVLSNRHSKVAPVCGYGEGYTPPLMPALHPCLVQLTLPSVCCVNAKVPHAGGIVLGCALLGWISDAAYLSSP